MSTTETKLRNFEKSVIYKAVQERDNLLADTDRKIEEALKTIKTKYESQARELYRKEIDDIKKEARIIVATAKNEEQTKLVQKRTQIIDSVFDELMQRLASFTQTEEYEKYYTNRLSEALQTAATHLGDRTGDVLIKLTPNDYKQRKELTETIAETVFMWVTATIEIADTDIIGGCIVELPEYGRLIDNSMLADVRHEKENFLSWSDLSLK